MNVALLVAAGSSRRMGGDKLLASLAGQPVLWHTVRAFQDCEDIHHIVVVTRPEKIEEIRTLCTEFSKANTFVEGGQERQDSVWNGLKALPAATEFVAVHDGARPLVTSSLISECLAAAHESHAVSCGTPVVDTLKKANEERWICGSADRDGLWSVQTPQVFKTPLLIEAYSAVIDRGGVVTDETSAVELYGGRVRLLHNPKLNIKVTFPGDLALAALVLEARRHGECPL